MESTTATNITAPVACPLSWAAALRRNLQAPRGAVRVRVELWLQSHGWQRDRNGWRDPMDGDTWSFEGAIRLQTIREAQLTLEARDWQLSGGTAHGQFWTGAWEVRHRDRAGYCSPAAALKREGLLYPTAIPKIVTHPPLQLVHGGRSA